MIERIENLTEIIVLVICLLLTLPRTFRDRTRSRILLSLVYSAFLLGDLYWTLYLFFYGKTPSVFYVSDLSWCAAYLFLNLLLHHYQTDEERGFRSPVLWGIPVFIIGMTVFFMTRGDYLLNLIYAVLMGMMMFRSVQGLLALRGKDDGRKMLFAAALIFCLIEYGIWTASCFWVDDTIRNPYFWFEALLIAIFPFFLRAVGKAENA